MRSPRCDCPTRSWRASARRARERTLAEHTRRAARAAQMLARVRDCGAAGGLNRCGASFRPPATARASSRWRSRRSCCRSAAASRERRRAAARGQRISGRAHGARRRRQDLLRDLALEVRHPAAITAARFGAADIAYVVQPKPAGLCDAIFRALPLIAPDEPVMVGLPDTIWFPEDALARAAGRPALFSAVPGGAPELFDAVVTDADGRVRAIRGEVARMPRTHWIWGAFKMPGRTLARAARAVARARPAATNISARWSMPGSQPAARRAACAPATSYVDVGTLNGYREAMRCCSTAVAEAHRRRSRSAPASCVRTPER